MTNIVTILLLFCVSMAMGACTKQPDKNPELSDPIYSDISSHLGTANSEVGRLEKELESAKKELEAAKPQTGELRVYRNQYFDALRGLEAAKQKALYLELRLKSRKSYARESYRKAFERGESWPNPGELKDYKTHQRLTGGPREWGDALRARLPASAAKPKEKKQEGGGH